MIARLACLLGLALASCGDSTEASHTPDHVRVRGTVLRAADWSPVEGAEVVGPGGSRARSGPSGGFVLKGIPRGSSGELRAELEGGGSAAVQLRPLEQDELEVVLHLRQP